MAGDIILSNGTVITASELSEIAGEVKKLIAKDAKEPSQYEQVQSLANLTTLPALLQNGLEFKLVRVAVELLNPVLQKTDLAIQWKRGDTGQFVDLITIAEIQAPAKAATDAANAAATKANTAATNADTATGKANTATTNANAATTAANNAAASANAAATAANNAADRVDDSITDISAEKTAAINAANSANQAATSANSAATKANTAATSANNAASAASIAATEATSATTETRKATSDAVAAATSANNAASRADTAAGSVNKSIADCQAVTTVCASTNQTASERIASMDALLKAFSGEAAVSPVRLVVAFPGEISTHNKASLRIEAKLLPYYALQNVIFLISEGNSLRVDPSGSLSRVGVGVTAIYVIPTQNTSLWQRVEIYVRQPRIRLTSAGRMRKASTIRIS